MVLVCDSRTVFSFDSEGKFNSVHGMLLRGEGLLLLVIIVYTVVVFGTNTDMVTELLASQFNFENNLTTLRSLETFD